MSKMKALFHPKYLIALVLCASVLCARSLSPSLPNQYQERDTILASGRNIFLEGLLSGHTFYGKSSIVKANLISDNVQRDIILVKATYQMDIAALTLSLHIDPTDEIETMHRLAYALVLVRSGKSPALLDTELYEGNSQRSHRDVYGEPKNIIIFDHPTVSRRSHTKIYKSYKFLYPMKIPMMPGDTIRLVYKTEQAHPVKMIRKNMFVGLISGHLSFLDEQDARNYVDNRLQKVYN